MLNNLEEIGLNIKEDYNEYEGDKKGGKAKVIGSLIEAGSQMIPGTGSKEAEIATSKADVLLGAHNRGKL